MPLGYILSFWLSALFIWSISYNLAGRFTYDRLLYW